MLIIYYICILDFENNEISRNKMIIILYQVNTDKYITINIVYNNHIK
jgi:hypothetical protein